jgi:hypothetical protein
MPFLNIPLKSIQTEVYQVVGSGQMPWYNPTDFPVVPGNPYPSPVSKDYKWGISMLVQTQQQSSYLTRSPGKYNGQDISVGDWIANTNTGQAWQIISINSKTSTIVEATVQDVYRYNTFSDITGAGNGAPPYGNYIVFTLNESGVPLIDPVPPSGVSPFFTQNLQSRFQYINLQYDYPLYQFGNNFSTGDVIAVSSVTNSFVLADSNNRIVIGTVTSISDTRPGWFTINPSQKIVDNFDNLVGNVGDIIYSSLTSPGDITTTPGGNQLYIKLRNSTSSISLSKTDGPTLPGNVFQLNNIDVTVTGAGSIDDVIADTNIVSAQTGVSALKVLTANSVQSDQLLLSSLYNEVILKVDTTSAAASINGVLVTFNIQSPDPVYFGYAQAKQMAESINMAAIPDVIATSPNPQTLILTNLAGGAINIINAYPDINGVNFAGGSSGSGIALNTAASSDHIIKFTAIDARPINFLDVTGSTVEDFGLTSVENGIKACGLYISNGLRTSNSTVVTNLAQLSSLRPLIGDQAFVINSEDIYGNNNGEWSQWLYDGSNWVQTSNQQSSTTDAKSLEYTIDTTTLPSFNIGEVSTGRRVTLITVQVITPFNLSSSLSIGYIVNNILTPDISIDGLMAQDLIDLTTIGTYTSSTDILFGIDTPQGDVNITGTFNINGSTTGEARIIVSYI